MISYPFINDFQYGVDENYFYCLILCSLVVVASIDFGVLVGSEAIGSVDTFVTSAFAGVSAAIVIAFIVVTWGVSEISSDSTNLSVPKSVVSEGVVRGKVIGV